MSNLLEEIKNTKIEITFEQLELVQYHNLKDKFTELGQGDLFQPGTKKVKMIENVINALKEVEFARLQSDKKEFDKNEALKNLKESVDGEMKTIIKNKNDKREEAIQTILGNGATLENIEISLRKTYSVLRTATDYNRPKVVEKIEVLEEVQERLKNKE